METTVRFVDNGMCTPYTRWDRDGRVVIHDTAEDIFLCCTSAGELQKATGSLRAALDWLAGK